MKIIRTLLLMIILAGLSIGLSGCGSGPDWEDSSNFWVNVNGNRINLGTDTVADIESFVGASYRVVSVGETMRFLNYGLPVVVGTELARHASVWIWSGDIDRQSRYNWPDVDRMHVSLRGSQVIPFEGWYVTSFSYRNNNILYPYVYSLLYNYIETAWGVVGTTTIYEIYARLGEPTRESTRTTSDGITITRWSYGGGETWDWLSFDFNELGVKTGVSVNSFDFTDHPVR